MIRNCDNCGKQYHAKDADIKRGWSLCCSKSCAASKREKAKPGYNPAIVKANNFKRANWNASSGYTSEGYRIINGIAYDEFNDPVYNYDPNDERHPFDLDD